MLMPEPAPRDLPTLREIGKKVGEASGAKKVILFGSIARGDAKEDSDLDLLLLLDSEDEAELFKAFCEARRSIWPHYFALDLITMPISRFINGKSLLADEISVDGVILFERN